MITPKKIFQYTAGALFLGLLVWAAIFFEAAFYLQQALIWIESIGFWGPTVFVLLYVLICVLLIPGSILTLGAGAVFGVLRGTLYTSVGATLGATLAFILGRTLLRGWVGRQVAERPRLRAVDEAVGREGGRVVFLLRLSPLVPFSISNYVYGLTKIKLGPYVLASWIGMLPGTLMYAYIGSLARRIAELGAQGEVASTWEWVLYAVGFVATIFATYRIALVARRALGGTIETTSDPDDGTVRATPEASPENLGG